MKTQNQNENAETTEMTSEELDQVSGGNIWSSISANNAAIHDRMNGVITTMVENRARTPDPSFDGMNHYIMD